MTKNSLQIGLCVTKLLSSIKLDDLDYVTLLQFVASFLCHLLSSYGSENSTKQKTANSKHHVIVKIERSIYMEQFIGFNRVVGWVMGYLGKPHV
mmetsp:Transcript_39206/g.57256  ORF Transcript_39206/g.57256 Transcript_39206/m.57256 type:complete len:94 (-) Transcript_39206:362-643(-)